jgi:hypothetical protein
MTKREQAEVEQAKEHLRNWLKPGDTVYTILRHVSRSGMQREIGLYVVRGDEVQWLGGWAATALGYRIGKYDGLVVGGCGMDMGFHLVYNLSRVLFRDGFGCIGDRETSWRIHTEETCPARSYHDAAKPDACEHRESWTSRASCPSNDHSNGDRDYTPHLTLRAKVLPGQEDSIRHWHADGGYALRHRWL